MIKENKKQTSLEARESQDSIERFFFAQLWKSQVAGIRSEDDARGSSSRN